MVTSYERANFGQSPNGSEVLKEISPSPPGPVETTTSRETTTTEKKQSSNNNETHSQHGRVTNSINS